MNEELEKSQNEMDCDEVFSRTILPATGHDMVEEYIPPTCSQGGCYCRYCATCGYQEPVQDIPAIPCQYGNWVIDKNPTCGDFGTKHRKCKICNHVQYSRIAPTKNHKHVKYVVLPASTSQNGERYHICMDCKREIDNNLIWRVKSISLSRATYTYDGKAKRPAIKVMDSRGNVISSKYYDVNYMRNPKNAGEYKVTIQFKGRYRGYVEMTYRIVPRSTSVSSLSKGDNKFTVRWKKQKSNTSFSTARQAISKTLKLLPFQEHQRHLKQSAN